VVQDREVAAQDLLGGGAGGSLGLHSLHVGERVAWVPGEVGTSLEVEVKI
jgi:hypothetical protein